MPRNGNAGRRKGQFEVANYFLLTEQNVVWVPWLLSAFCNLCDQAIPIYLPVCSDGSIVQQNTINVPLEYVGNFAAHRILKELSPPFWNPNVHCRVHKSSTAFPSLVQTNAFYNFESSFWNDNFNVAFPFTPTFAFNLFHHVYRMKLCLIFPTCSIHITNLCMSSFSI
jgi:hypothetical protein